MTREIKYTNLEVDNPYNSTLFTLCCGCAVIEEYYCPECGRVVRENLPTNEIECEYVLDRADMFRKY